MHAELRVALTDSGHGFALHRMLRSWSEGSVTWSSLGGGIDADGSDAVAAPDLVTFDYLDEGESPGYSIFDVTASVRAWAEGQANHGWAILPLGSDKLIFDSAEGTRPPRLIVDYRLPGSHQIAIASGQDTYLWRSSSQANFGASDRIRVDLSDSPAGASSLMPMQGLLRFELQGVVPAGAMVTRAVLRLRLTDSGHGFRLHRMLVPWSEHAVTWGSLGEDVDDDGTDAAVEPDALTEDYLAEPPTAGYLALEVTDAVRAWLAGQPNHGWALLPVGEDKLIIESFQGTTLRPELVVDYTLP